jgi:hypothetical protein
MSIYRSGKHARIVDSKRRHVKQMFPTKQGHPEPIRCAQGKLWEGSDVTGYEMLRCAQHDKWTLSMTSRALSMTSGTLSTLGLGPPATH